MPTINSAEEAQAVARLIQQGRITGDARDTALQALRTFDATGAKPPSVAAPTAPSQATDLYHAIPTPAPANAPAAAPEQPSALTDWGGALASAAVRPLVKAVTATPLAAMDAGVASRNLIGDAVNRLLGRPATPDYTLPSTLFNQGLDSVTREPQGIGKAAELANTLIAGGALPAPSALTRTSPVAPTGFISGVSDNPQLAAAAAARRAAPSGLTGAQQQAATAGQQLGMRMTPGQSLGSRALQQLEARLESRPATSGPFSALKVGNQAVLNRAAAQAIGENTDTVDSSVLSRANDRLGDVFANVRSANRTVMADPKATSDVLDGIDDQFEGLLPGDMSIRDNKLVGQLQSLTAQGHIDGQQLGQLSSKLGKAAYKQMSAPNGDRDLGKALYAVKDHVDDLVQSTLTPQEAAEYTAARQQYRNLMTLTSRTSIVNPSTGNVSGVALANKLQSADKPGFLYGRNQSPMYQAARFAQAFKPIVGDSGTATRSAGHGLGSLGLLGLGSLYHLPIGEDVGLAALPLAGRLAANLGTRAYLSRPGTALVRAGLGVLPQLARGTLSTLRALPRNPAMLSLPGTLILPPTPGSPAQRIHGVVGVQP